MQQAGRVLQECQDPLLPPTRENQQAWCQASCKDNLCDEDGSRQQQTLPVTLKPVTFLKTGRGVRWAKALNEAWQSNSIPRTPKGGNRELQTVRVRLLPSSANFLCCCRATQYCCTMGACANTHTFYYNILINLTNKKQWIWGPKNVVQYKSTCLTLQVLGLQVFPIPHNFSN